MSEHNVETQWNGKMNFKSSVDDFDIQIDADESVGGENKGPRPKKLMLTALAGCTGMDVISILDKMKIKPDDFRINITGKVNEEHPKKYNEIIIIYKFKGNNLDENKINKAINLS
ncbi:MAG: OsmC family protein, partial [bacterium]